MLTVTEKNNKILKINHGNSCYEKYFLLVMIPSVHSF